MASRVINISLPEELLREIERVAKRERRTRSEFFREAARRYIEAKQQQAIDAAGGMAERQGFAALSAPAFNRLWDNPIDAKLWDMWEETHAIPKKTPKR